MYSLHPYSFYNFPSLDYRDEFFKEKKSLETCIVATSKYVFMFTDVFGDYFDTVIEFGGVAALSGKFCPNDVSVPNGDGLVRAQRG